MYCRVIPFAGAFDNYGLVYFVPESERKEIANYQIVSIPLKNTIQIAVVFEVLSDIPDGIEKDKIKSLIKIIEKDSFLFPYQARIVEYISRNYITPIHNALGVFFPKNLREKITKETLNKVLPKEYSYEYNTSSQLTQPQQKALEEVQTSTNKKTLLYGITGSGKTEIYREIISKNLKEGKQTLLLIPEIILGNQIGERISEMFGNDVLVISSNVTEAKKTQYRIDIHSGNAKVIVGTRSALFYPYSNLGGIIVDEEHDNSYVSDSAPRYSSIDVVSQISEELDIPVVFASGTPSIESMYRAMKGEYELVSLLEKYVE